MSGLTFHAASRASRLRWHPNRAHTAGVALFTPLLRGTPRLHRGPSAGGVPSAPFPGPCLSPTWMAHARSPSGGEAPTPAPRKGPRTGGGTPLGHRGDLRGQARGRNCAGSTPGLPPGPSSLQETGTRCPSPHGPQAMDGDGGGQSPAAVGVRGSWLAGLLAPSPAVGLGQVGWARCSVFAPQKWGVR